MTRILRLLPLVVLAASLQGCTLPRPAGGVAPFGAVEAPRRVICDGVVRDVVGIATQRGVLLPEYNVYYVALESDAPSTKSPHAQPADELADRKLIRRATRDLPRSHESGWLASLSSQLSKLKPRHNKYVLGFEPVVFAFVARGPDSPFISVRPLFLYRDSADPMTDRLAIIRAGQNSLAVVPDDTPVLVVELNDPVPLSEVQRLLIEGTLTGTPGVQTRRVMLGDIR